MALEQAMQAGARQMRKAVLQGVETIIQRQQRVLPEGDAQRFFFRRRHCGARILRPHRGVFNALSRPPLATGLLIDPVLLG